MKFGFKKKSSKSTIDIQKLNKNLERTKQLNSQLSSMTFDFTKATDRMLVLKWDLKVKGYIWSVTYPLTFVLFYTLLNEVGMLNLLRKVLKMAKVMLTVDDVIDTEEEIKGTREFSFTEILKGILFGGKDFVDEVNQAVDDAYAELELA